MRHIEGYIGGSLPAVPEESSRTGPSFGCALPALQIALSCVVGSQSPLNLMPVLLLRCLAYVALSAREAPEAVRRTSRPQQHMCRISL